MVEEEDKDNMEVEEVMKTKILIWVITKTVDFYKHLKITTKWEAIFLLIRWEGLLIHNKVLVQRCKLDKDFLKKTQISVKLLLMLNNLALLCSILKINMEVNVEDSINLICDDFT